jgi:hypothetical protein
MITCGTEGKILVQIGQDSFDLSVSDEYANLVLRLTSPDTRIQFNESDFAVDESLANESRDKAERYAQFLTDFLERRKAKLEEDKTLSAEKREASIIEFIDNLKRKDE